MANKYLNPVFYIVEMQLDSSWYRAYLLGKGVVGAFRITPYDFTKPVLPGRTKLRSKNRLGRAVERFRFSVRSHHRQIPTGKLPFTHG